MTTDELAIMSGKKCILQIRGVRPFLSEKYNIAKHKNYKYLADNYDDKNKFNISEYLKNKNELKLKSDDKIIDIDDEIENIEDDLLSESLLSEEC